MDFFENLRSKSKLIDSADISPVYDSLVKTGIYSDFTITCLDHKFKVHKEILKKYDYFKSKFEFNEDDCLEISLDYLSPDCVEKEYNKNPDLYLYSDYDESFLFVKQINK